MFYPEWAPSFNPLKPRSLLILMWITLRLLIQEFSEMALQVAGRVGKVLMIDLHSAKSSTPRFYIGLDIHKGWMSTITIPTIHCKDALVFI
jgi:hypothetical protein